MTYQKDGYEDTEEDFNQIIKIVNETDLSKTSIQNELRAHENYQYMNFKSDTISLNRALLIFKNNKLKKIVKHW